MLNACPVVRTVNWSSFTTCRAWGTVLPTRAGTGWLGVNNLAWTARATPPARSATAATATAVIQGHRRRRAGMGPPCRAEGRRALLARSRRDGLSRVSVVTEAGTPSSVASAGPPTKVGPPDGRHHHPVHVRGFVAGDGVDGGDGAGLGQGGGQLLQPERELGGVEPLGRLRGGRPHQHVVERSEGVVLGQQGPDPGHEGGDGGVADERRLPGDPLVQHEGQGVDVGLAVQHEPFDLLGGRVTGRAQDGAVRFGPRRLGQRPGQPEVGDPESAVGVEEQVGRLDVPVDEPAAVGVVEPGGGLEADQDRLLRSEQGPGVVDLAEAAAGQELQHQVRLVVLLAPVVDLEDVGVVEGGHRSGLGPEPLEEVGVAGQRRVEDLDGHPSVEGDVVGQVDVRGRTGPQGGDQSVAVAEDTPDGVGDTRHDLRTRLPSRGPQAVEGRPDDRPASGRPRRPGQEGRATPDGPGRAETPFGP